MGCYMPIIPGCCIIIGCCIPMPIPIGCYIIPIPPIIGFYIIMGCIIGIICCMGTIPIPCWKPVAM